MRPSNPGRRPSAEASGAVAARGAGMPGPAGNGSLTGPAERKYTLPAIEAYNRGGEDPDMAGPGRPRKPRTPPPVPAFTAGSVPPRGSRAVAYVRVSTDDQADNGYGLDAQRDAIGAYVVAQGWVLVETAGDPGVGGGWGLTDRKRDGSPYRPGLHRAFEVIEAGGADVIVVLAQDRLYRSNRATFEICDRLDRSGPGGTPVPIGSVREGIVWPSLMRDIRAALAAEEKRNIAERTRGGRLAKLADGGIVGRVPFGYRITGQRKHTRVEIVEEQAAVVRRIFTLRESRASFGAIAKALNADGVPTPKGAGQWHMARVWDIIENPAYRGVLRWVEGGRETAVAGAMPVIVPATPSRRQPGRGAGTVPTRSAGTRRRDGAGTASPLTG